MLTRLSCCRRLVAARCTAIPIQTQPRRWLLPAPHPDDSQPILERRTDRELPDPEATRFRWSRSLPWFLLLMAGSAAALINYERGSSSAVTATLFSLRRSARARALLGDEIYFRDRMPWIWGTLSPLHGRIDIAFAVRGTLATGYVRFHSERPAGGRPWQTQEWSLDMGDGAVVDLLQGNPVSVPMAKLEAR